MKQEIGQPRRLIAPKQIAEQLVLLGPDAGKARDRRKQGIEEERAHPVSRRTPIVMRGLDPRIHLQKRMDCRVKPGNDGTVDNLLRQER